MQSVKGNVTLRGVNFELNGTREENQGILDTITGVLQEAYSAIEVGRSVAEFKVKLDAKVNLETDTGEKITNQNDFLNKFVAEGWLGEEATFVGYLNSLKLNNYSAVEALEAVETEQPLYVVDLIKIEGTLTDGQSIKTLKSGTVKVGGEVVENILPIAVDWAANAMLEEVSMIVGISCLPNESMYETQEIGKVKIDSPEGLVAFAQMYNVLERQPITVDVDEFKQLNACLTNLKTVDIVGLTILSGTLAVYADTGVVYYVASNNKFWQVEGKSKKVLAFNDWYLNVKDHYEAKDEMEVIPQLLQGEFVSGFTVKIGDEIQVVGSVAELRSLVRKARLKAFEEIDRKFIELENELDDHVEMFGQFREELEEEIHKAEAKPVRTEEAEVEVEAEDVEDLDPEE